MKGVLGARRGPEQEFREAVMKNFCNANSPLKKGITSVCIAVFGLTLMFAAVSDAHAQRRKSVFGGNKSADKKADSSKGDKAPAAARKQTGTAPPAGIQRKKIDEEFAPQNLIIEVRKEGIQLAITWFPPIIEKDSKGKKKAINKEAAEEKEPGKSVAPFILVHDWTRNRADLLSLGSFLQSQGHAVIVPDLRGHGQSLTVAGSTKQLDHSKFRKAEKASAVRDIDQCKRFLQEKNNEGILNIDLLNVVAVGDSAHLAIAWAIGDWSWGPVQGRKQGKDVKSLILFSPTRKFAGSALKKMTKEPLISGRNSTPLPMLVIWGGNSEAAEGCSSWIKLLRKFRPEVGEDQPLETRWANQNLFHVEPSTSMTGFELAGNPNARDTVWTFVNNFVSQKVMSFEDQCPWQLRGAAAAEAAEEEDN